LFERDHRVPVQTVVDRFPMDTLVARNKQAAIGRKIVSLMVRMIGANGINLQIAVGAKSKPAPGAEGGRDAK
jgi:hypothetical protein